MNEGPSLADGAASGARFLANHDRVLLSRIEDAGLNASAPPQQRWVDGWLVRFGPGKAQRARCVNALAEGRRPVPAKLAESRALLAGQGLPLLVRITPFTQPPSLDAELAAQGFVLHDDTRVMVLPGLASLAAQPPAPPPEGLVLSELDAEAFADAVGIVRGSSAADRAGHARRLRESPVPYRGFALQSPAGETLACGQFAQEGALVGLYDVATATAAQRRGLGAWLCEHMLRVSTSSGATTGYLQVGANNDAARRIYARLGFADAYSYHYRIER